jgi:hypothetical protein
VVLPFDRKVVLGRDKESADPLISTMKAKRLLGARESHKEILRIWHGSWAKLSAPQ